MKSLQTSIPIEITVEEAIQLAERFAVTLTSSAFDNLKDGDLFCKIINPETKIETMYFIKRIFIQEIDLKYSANNKVRQGKELLISNFHLPKFNSA